MDEEIRKSLEYEEQFFGMSSRFFAISFRNFVKDELELKIGMLVESLKAKLINQTADPEKFEQGLKIMETELKNEYFTCTENLYEEVLSNISNFMHIPQNVLLKEDLPVKEGINYNINDLREEIDTLEGIYKSVLYLKQEIKEELDEADSAIFLVESVLKKENFDFSVLPVNEIAAFSKQNNLSLNNKD